MPTNPKVPCEKHKREPAEFRVTELLITKKHKPKPFNACRACASRASNLAGKLVERL